MTEHTMIIVTFNESSKAYEAFSDLKSAANENRVDLKAAVLVEREQDGTLHVPEGADNVTGAGTIGGGLIGSLFGVLGGPLGLLLGWGSGALIGGVIDAQRMDRSETALSAFSSRLLPGTTGIAIEAEEYAPEVIDSVMTPLGGTVYRYPAEQVLAELEAAQDAADAAEREANRKLREERRAERKENWDQRIDALKQKFA